jgi:hypothetical protein
MAIHDTALDTARGMGARDGAARMAAGSNLASRLYAAEAAIDAAVVETAALMSELPLARADLWLSAVSGQRAFDEAAASVGALAQARGHLVATHRTLAAVARRIGLDDLAVGPLDKPEDTPPIGDGPKGLTARSGASASPASIP